MTEKIDRAALRALLKDMRAIHEYRDGGILAGAAQSIATLLSALDAAEARERKLREALMTIKTAAGNVVWNAGRGVRAAGSEYDRCWEHVSSTACAALAETAP